jgi:hypothetical protein
LGTRCVRSTPWASRSSFEGALLLMKVCVLHTITATTREQSLWWWWCCGFHPLRSCAHIQSCLRTEPQMPPLVVTSAGRASCVWNPAQQARAGSRAFSSMRHYSQTRNRELRHVPSASAQLLTDSVCWPEFLACCRREQWPAAEVVSGVDGRLATRELLLHSQHGLCHLRRTFQGR